MRERSGWDNPARIWLAGLATVSVVCLLVTIFREQIASASGMSGQVFRTLHLTRLGLAYEKSVGAWWQSMLLLLASLHALDGYFRHRHAEARLARAWLLLAIVVCSLSFDEVGSLHERVPKYLPPGGWLSLLPFALLLGGMAGYAIATLLRTPAHRPTGMAILVAFALFGAVAVQEELEFTTRWWGEFDDLRTGLEEGTEMTAMLLLVAAAMGNTAGLSARLTAAVEPTFQGLDLLRTPIAAFGLIMAPAIGLISANLVDKHGPPISWLAAAMFACAALVALRPALQTGFKGSVEWTTAALVAGCGVLSVVAVNAHGPRFRFIVLSAGCLAAVVLWFIRNRGRGIRAPTVAAVALCVILALAWQQASPAFTMTVYAAAGAIVYAGNAASASSRTASDAVGSGNPHIGDWADATGTFARSTFDDRR